MIEVTAIHEGTNVVIAVRDYGMGIPDSNKNKVFEMFTVANLMA